MLAGTAAVREIAAGDDQVGLDALDQRGQAALDVGRFLGAHVDVRDMEEPCWLSRTSGYTHGDGRRAYRDLRRPLSRSACRRSAPQEATRRAAHDGRGRGPWSLGIAVDRSQGGDD